MNDLAVDPETLAYLELISGRKGPQAISAWLCLTECPLAKPASKEAAVAAKLERAAQNAAAHWASIDRGVPPDP
jgi:hypothetical protein